MYFWSFYRFQGYFGHSSGFNVFLVVLKFLEYFGHFNGFEGILVILVISDVFWLLW